LRTLHLEGGTHLYGGALQVLFLVEGLRRRGVDCLLLVPRGSEVETEARGRGLPVQAIPMAGEGDPLLPIRLRKAIRAFRPHLVHLHSRRGADTLGALGARWSGVPVVLTRRVDNPEPSWLVGPKYRLPQRVIAISEAIQAVLLRQGVPEEKLRCVRSALDAGPYLQPCRREAFLREFGLQPGDLAVGMAAQFIPRKGHEVLLRAAPAILRRHPRTRFLLFGRGPLAEAVGRQAEDAGLGAAVLLPGFRPDLPEILPCLDLLVHPAMMEGLGIILLQASASGIPVVASAAGGVPEAVAHGETGLLVPPGDPSALAEAVCLLLDQPGLRRDMGARGRQRVLAEFSVDRMVEGNLAVYRELLDA
jgi:glycosyltransferase involved in cell wall biosynthesis